jgi:hypothetical protein
MAINYRTDLNPKLIPEGPYCYTIKEVTDDGQIRLNLCPYWFSTVSGLCGCLYTGDVDVDPGDGFDKAQSRYTEAEIELLTGGGDGLLWDQVKGCDINDSVDDEDPEDGHDCHSCGRCAC